MKANFFSERDADLRHTSLHPVIRAVQFRVPLNALILHFFHRHRQRVTNGKPTTPICHPVRKINILQMTLRYTPYIIHLIMIIFRQNPNQILHHKNGVVVTHHEPPRPLPHHPHCLRYNPRDSDR